MLALLVGIPAFVALLIEGHEWFHTLSTEERVWPLVGMCVVLGVAAAITALDRKRRAFGACSAALALLGVGLVLTAGGVSTPTNPAPHKQTRIPTANSPVHHHHKGGGATGSGGTQAISNTAFVVPRKSRPSGTVVRKRATPVRSAPTPTKKAPATKSSVVQEAHGKDIAQATGHSHASVGGEKPSAPASETTPKIPTPAATPQSTTQKAEGEGIAQASGESEAYVSKGNSFHRIAPAIARRWASASVVAMPLAHSAAVGTVARASSTKHHPRRKCRRRRCKRKRQPAGSVNQQAQGKGIAQATGKSIAVSGENNPVNSNNNNDNNNVTVQGQCGAHVQNGSSGSATVSNNGEGGNATSGSVTNEYTSEGSGTCSTNVQVGQSGAATVSGNTEGGNATSGDVENRS
jgi:hypothetical protein